jgi:hypothetical protein
MLINLLLGLAITVILFTATPILILREYVLSKIKNSLLTEIISCSQCTMFWLAIPLWFAIPYIPEFIHYAIYLCSIITVIDYLKTKTIP